MRRPITNAVLLFVLLVVPTLSPVPAQTGSRVSVAANGWSVSADAEQDALSVAYDNLGVVIKMVRLNLQGEHGLRQLKNWSVESKSRNQLSIKTVEPRTAWLFELDPNTLKISSTSVDAILTAQAPAGKNRVVARVLDTQGVPVTWQETDEVAKDFGGIQTQNASFLPDRNPECMYFALGQVSSSNLHSLFDRNSDTVISFSGQARMQRDSQDLDLLNVTIPVPGNTLIRITPEYFTKTLGLPFYVPFDDTHFSKAPMVWSSWLTYYAGVKEEDIVRNADWIAANLKPYGFEYVVLDDGYDRGKNGEHYWIENWDRAKFPHGPQWLTKYVKSKGLRAGIWLVPNAYAGAVEQHPAWYLRDKQGNTLLDYATPALDSTNPEVLSFLTRLFTTLDDWGFEYYKFDGEFALPKYTPAVDRDRLFDRSVDPVTVYRNRLKLIRETIGPKTFVEGCPAGTPLNGIGYFGAYFNGEDSYNTWKGMHALFSSINGNAFLNHIVTYLMPAEGMDLSPSMSLEEAQRKRPDAAEIVRVRGNDGPMAELGITLPEAHTLVTYVALTGVAYSLVSAMPELPDDRVGLLKMTLPTMPILPIDLFSRGTDAKYGLRDVQPDDFIHNYPEILDLKVNAKSGVYDVVGLTNWRSEPATKELSFADKLGLSAGVPYIAFDFWNQKLYGVFKDRMKVNVGPRDTRVFLIHPLLDRPQLMGISRHITGAYSLLDLGWDASRKRLRGSVESVPGEPYALFIYVPGGMSVIQARATVQGAREVAVRKELTGNSLRVSFQGQREVVNWEVEFATNAAPVPHH